MAIQYELDKTKPFGKVVGGGGAMLTQRGITFNVQGKRVSELTAEEVKAEAAEKAAAEAYQRSIKADEEAKSAVEAADQKKSEEAAKLAGPAPVNPNIPDVTNWTKADMINHAKNVFGVNVNPQKTWAAIKEQLEGLY